MNTTKITAIFGSHVATFILIYFGRTKGIPIAQSDILLFAAPSILAAAGYFYYYSQIIPNNGFKERLVLICVSSLTTASASLLVGMMVAFNMWGT